jgi:DNA-binding FadR family transcriptional regulator
VREALIALEVEGRVRIPRRLRNLCQRTGGAAPLLPVAAEIEGPFELLRAREFIEGAIAEQAARVATPEDIARIDASLEAMATVQHPGEASMIHDRAFHVAVAGCLDNAVLVRVVGELFDQRLNPYFAKLAHYFENPASWNAALAEHRAIRDAIAAHDPDAARVTMREHLARSQARFAQNFGTKLRPHPASAQGAAERPGKRPGIRTGRRNAGPVG